MSRAPLVALLTSLALAAPAAAATTIVPDTFGDPPVAGNCAAGHPAGSCTLRAAVAAAADGDSIQLAEGTYALELGSLSVAQDMTFVGAGPSATTIEQHKPGRRIIKFELGTTASMTGLTLTGGNFFGGDGVDETMVLPAGDGGGAYGGAIDASGTALSLTLVSVVGNSTTGGKGGKGYSPASGAGGDGGDGGYADESAIYASGHLTLDRVTVADNVAHGGDGGNGGNGTGSNNGGLGGKGEPGSGAVGGGSGMVLVVRDSTISGNKGFAGKGGNGGAGGFGAGGSGGDGGRSVRGTGGGIFSNGDVTIVNSTITGNEIHGGTGGKGGNDLFGSGGDGGYAEPGQGGGISLFNNITPGVHGHIASSTITNNSVFAGTGGAGGLGGVDGADGGTGSADGGNLDIYSDSLEIRDTVIAGGVGSASASNCSIQSSNFTSHGYNVDDTNQCLPTPATGDRSNLDPKLGTLQDNGGPTKTQAPLAGSPLINGGPTICQGAGTPLTADQRGAPRDAACDNGAYEAIAPAVGSPPSVAGSPVTGQTLTCVNGTFSGDAPQTVDTVWLRDGQQAATGSQYPIAAADAGHSVACRQTATNAYGSATANSTAVQITAAPIAPAAAAKLSKLKIRPKTLHHKTKAKVTFTLSAAARVTFKICKRKGKKCKRLKKGAPKAVNGKQGSNTVRLKAKGLKPGRYRLTATPAGGTGVRASFRVAQ